MHSNELIARAFADQFDPPLTVVRTEKINNVPALNAYTASAWDKERRLGVVLTVFGPGLIKAYLECAGPGENAEAFGKAIAETLGRLQV